MTSFFSEFPLQTKNSLEEIVEQMGELKNQIDNLQTTLQQSRQSFKDEINSYFAQVGEPFPTNGHSIADDIEQYIKLVSYCLEAGDSELLQQWGIESIREDASKLASDDFQDYCGAFEVLIEGSEVELEQMCFIELKNFFLTLASGHDLQTSVAM